MNFDLFDLAGFVGVLLIVIAYLLLQLDKLPSSSLSFSRLNIAAEYFQNIGATTVSHYKYRRRQTRGTD